MAAHVEGKEYDIIFAGGGATACVAAARLARANPNLSILLIERGRHGFNDPAVTIPGLFANHLAPGSETTRLFFGNKHDAVNGREIPVHQGNILGGGTAVNTMIYTRASAVDYDDWNMKGWDAESLIPLANRAETFHCSGPGLDESAHGHTGPINVSYGTHQGRPDDFLAAAKSMGEKILPDLQDFKSCGGFSRWPKYISPEGKRSDAASSYIQPLVESGNYANLHTLLETQACRVVFQGTRASAVEVEPVSNAKAETHARQPTRVVRAKKLVILSAGTLATPGILERSGLGSAARLQDLGIPVVSDLPGVGENYQDHNSVFCNYTTSLNSRETLDALMTQRLSLEDALRDKRPELGWNSFDVGAKLRPTPQEAASISPGFQKAWERDFQDKPGKSLTILATLFAHIGFAPRPDDPNTQLVTSVTCLSYPYSRGDVHITSRDPHAMPSFNHGYLTNELDLQAHVWVYKRQREFFRRTNLLLAEWQPSHPKFREGSRAAHIYPDPALRDAADPRFPSDEHRARLPPLEYDEEDDAVIAEWVRNNVSTTWHCIGTAKMAPRGERGVVDENLNVYGTQALKVADLSICPENVGANTANTAIIVGEKTAEIVAQELGFPLVI